MVATESLPFHATHPLSRPTLYASTPPGTRSAMELASLGPATVLCESLIYCSTFLAIAVTNLQATALAEGKQAEAQKVRSCHLTTLLRACLLKDMVVLRLPEFCHRRWIHHLVAVGVRAACLQRIAREQRLYVAFRFRCKARAVEGSRRC